MSTAAVPRIRVSRHQPLAVCIGGVLCLASPLALAITFVTNCNDAGIGSLRAAVAGALEGDTVDASGLAGVCSTITLTTGDIVVNKNDLTIKGPGMTSLSIFGTSNNGHRILTHTGTGTLTLESLTLSKGYQISDSAFGGCVYSKGNVLLDHVGAYACETSGTQYSEGGAIFTQGSTSVSYSVIAVNTAYAGGPNCESIGGGVYARNGFSAIYSTISGNSSRGVSGRFALAGC
jgi:hypothetical protein